MWQYDLCAFMSQWELVLEAKWALAAAYQGRIESEVNPMLNKEVVTFLKGYADELFNRYQVKSVPEYMELLALIERLDGKPYKPSAWSL